MHRFYLPPGENEAGLRLDGREAHHALNVLRLKSGDRVTVLDGVGTVRLCEIEQTVKDSLSLKLCEMHSTPPPPCAITLLVAVPKGKIIEDIIEKAVELGAQRVVPLLTERVVTQLDTDMAEARRDKWQQVAIEAIKQCGAAWLPIVETPQAISKYLSRASQFELSLVGSLQMNRRHPREWLSEFHEREERWPATVGVWIGPEGDFTEAELQAIEAAGAKPVTLGPLTLRVETAALYCLSVLNYESQAWVGAVRPC